MEFRRTRKFREQYHALPTEIKEVVKARFSLLIQNPQYPYPPALKMKPMQGHASIWEGHITPGYVFTFHRDRDEEGNVYRIVFRKIGRHDIYRNP